jgi:hypothetical protein
MPRSIIKHAIASLVLVAILVGIAGCDMMSMVGNSVFFGLGAMFASGFQTTTTDYRCYRNGVEVDCSTMDINPS